VGLSCSAFSLPAHVFPRVVLVVHPEHAVLDRAVLHASGRTGATPAAQLIFASLPPASEICHSDRRDGGLGRPGVEESLYNYKRASVAWSGTTGWFVAEVRFGSAGIAERQKRGEERTGPALNPLKGSSARLPHSFSGARRSPI
jgi:hypothetical protein